VRLCGKMGKIMPQIRTFILPQIRGMILEYGHLRDPAPVCPHTDQP
jgi:hypothetical protein